MLIANELSGDVDLPTFPDSMIEETWHLFQFTGKNGITYHDLQLMDRYDNVLKTVWDMQLNEEINDSRKHR